jgi:hypothetical protein
MSRATPTPLDRQLSRVRRRLFLQTLVETTVKGWVVALAVSACWFLAQPFVVADAPQWLRWTVLGGAAGFATIATILWAVLRVPSRVAAALSLDERFQLRERATTSMLLREEEAASPAGQALLDDVNRRVQPLHVGDRFPVRVPWSAALVPAFGIVLALLAFFYNPLVGKVDAKEEEQLTKAPDVQAEIEKKLNKLQPKGKAKTPEDKPKSEELQRIEHDLDKLSRQPHETKEQAREIIKEATQIEEQIKKRDKELAEKAEALKEQMKQVARLNKQEKKDGPADKMAKALDQGDLKNAKNEADRLSKKLKDAEETDKLKKKLDDPNASEEEKKEARDQLEKKKDKELTPEEKEKLQEQLKDMQDKLERLTRQGDEANRLREMAQRGELDKEQLQRELDQLEKNSEKLDREMPDLKDAAEKLKECQQCMKEGKDGEAAQKLQEAAAMLGKANPNGEAQDLADQLKQLQEAKKAMCQALDGKPVPASGARPEGKDHDTKHSEERVRSELDKGKMHVVDHLPGDGFKGPRSPAQLQEEIRKASQEAPEAIDRQRLPRSASDMARGYFEKLRGPEKDEKKGDK